MTTFKSLGWYRVRARGWASWAYCDQERPRSASGLEGTLVEIDGETFKCIGVERHLLSDAVPIRKGERIGLLVEPVT